MSEREQSNLNERPFWGDPECGDMRNSFNFTLITSGDHDFRLQFTRNLMETLWSHRYDIRFEAHGIAVPDQSEGECPMEEYFDNSTVPLVWTKWLDLPDPVSHDAPTTVKDAVITDSVVDLVRQPSRRQSATLHAILDRAWVDLTSACPPERAMEMEMLSAVGDVSKLQRIITFTIDGFEEEPSHHPHHLISMLRDFILFFVHNPTSDSASGFNSYVKKRARQWYDDPPHSPEKLKLLDMWTKYLVRTPAARSLSKLLETRRFFARSHQPLEVSYNKISTICKELFRSDDIWKRAVALMFALGTRPNELFRSFVDFRPSSIAYSPSDDRMNWLVQTGTSKCASATRLMTENGKPSENEKRHGMKPILFGFRAPDVIEAIYQLRMDADVEFKASSVSGGQSMEDAPTSAITMTVVQKLSKMMYSAFPSEGDKCTERGHLFGGLFSRKFYACASLKEFESSYKDVMTPNQFVAEILLHQPGMPTDSVHYVTLNLLYGDSDKPYIIGQEGSDTESKEGDEKKKSKKKRKINGHDDAMFGPTSNEVTLKTIDSKAPVTIQRFSHRRFNNEQERQDYYEAVKAYLVEKNVRPSIANLTAIGVSPQFQSARKKHFKKAVLEMNKAKEELIEAQRKVNDNNLESKEADTVVQCSPGDEPKEPMPPPIIPVNELRIPKLKRQRALSGSAPEKRTKLDQSIPVISNSKTSTKK